MKIISNNFKTTQEIMTEARQTTWHIRDILFATVILISISLFITAVLDTISSIHPYFIGRIANSIGDILAITTVPTLIE